MLWDGTRFQRDRRLLIDDDGRIAAVGSVAELEGDPERMHGAMMPGLVNGHSHAFQFALRGRAERFGLVQGSFWSWRDAMYDLVDSLDADRCHELSLASFNEMIAHGVTTVGEFHYVRHDDAQDHRLDDAVMVAAEDAGIRMVKLVTCYQTGDIGKPLEGAQARFDTVSVDAKTYQTNMIVLDDAPIIGQTIEEAGLRHLPGLYLSGIERGTRVLPAVVPEEVLEAVHGL